MFASCALLHLKTLAMNTKSFPYSHFRKRRINNDLCCYKAHFSPYQHPGSKPGVAINRTAQVRLVWGIPDFLSEFQVGKMASLQRKPHMWVQFELQLVRAQG